MVGGDVDRSPTLGSRVGAKSIWNDEHSMTWMRSAAGGGRSKIGVPMLPPSATSRPALLAMWAISAVVVDLPLVPVIATKGDSSARARLSRTNSSMSPITSTPAAFARSTVQWGLGWVSGTPGASTSAANCDQSAAARSTSVAPASAAFLRAASLSSHGATFAPPGQQRSQGRQAGAAKPEQRDRFARKGASRGHRHLNFSVERPTIASTMAIIQKRMTICDSDQPSCSK